MRVVPQTDLHIQTLKKLEADFPDVGKSRTESRCNQNELYIQFIPGLSHSLSLIDEVIPSLLGGRQLQKLHVVCLSGIG